MPTPTGGTGWFKVGQLRMQKDICFLVGSAAPTSGGSGTGVNVAGPGSLYFRTATGAVYANTNTKASPTWSQLGTTAALASGDIFVGSAGGAATDVAMTGDLSISNAGVTAIGAGKVLSAMVSPLLVQYATVSIATASVKTLNSVPYQVLAAPASGKVILVHGALVAMTYNSVQYTGGGTVTLVDHSTHTAVHTGGIANTVIQAAASFAYWLGPLTGASGTTRPTATAIDIEAASADFAAGNSAMSAHLWYSVVTP